MISDKLVRAKARILGMATAALVLSAIALPAKAQPYPSRSITILVGYPAGGQADALARQNKEKRDAKEMVTNRGVAEEDRKREPPEIPPTECRDQHPGRDLSQ